MSVLWQVIKKNAREREEERNEPEVIDSQMLWLLMHTLRRNAARRVSHCSFVLFFYHIMLVWQMPSIHPLCLYATQKLLLSPLFWFSYTKCDGVIAIVTPHCDH